MPILRLATRRETRNPVRVQQWNATMRAGDDFKLALTVYGDDSGSPSVVLGSRSQLVLWPDDRRYTLNSWDYGLGWFTGATYGPGFPSVIVAGFTTPMRGGGINFALPAATTVNLICGRYRLSVQIDLPDGEFSQVEGILQVRERWARPGLGHVPFTAAQLAAIVPPLALINGQFVDADGFFLLTADFREGARPGDFNPDFNPEFPH